MSWPQQPKRPYGGPKAPYGSARSGSNIPDGPFSFDPATSRNAIAWAGLSYTFGDQGFPAISTAQNYQNVRAVNSTDARAPSGTPDLIPLVANTDMESLMEGSTNQLARNWADLRNWIIHDRAVGGSELTDQDTGSTPFNNQLGMVEDVVDLVAPDSVVYRALCTSGFGFIEEALNAEAWATFEARLLTFLDDYRAQILLRTGQDYDFPLVLHQTGWWVLGGTPTPAGYALEQLNLALANPDVVLTGASYQYAIGGDNVHLTNDAYLAFAEHYGEVLTQLFQRGITWLPLYITEAEAIGNTVVLTYHVPAVEFGRHAGGDQLVLDTGAYGWRAAAADGTTHGYRYLENAGPARTITGVSVSGNQVTLTLNGAAEIGASIGYADIGAQAPALPAGNLRDTWDGVSDSGNPDHLFNWACAQQIEITGDAPPFTNLSSLEFDGNGDAVVIGDRPEFDLATAMTISVWLQSDVGAVYKSIISKFNFSTQNCFELARLPNDRVRMYVSNAINQTTHNIDSTSIIAEGGGWTHLVVVYDGSLVGNTNRVRFYFASILDVPAANTGTIPAALLATTSELRLGLYDPSSATSSFDGRMDEPAIWVGQAATQAQVDELFNGGEPGNLNLTSLGQPTFWYRGDGDVLPTVINHGSAAGANGTVVNNVALSAAVP